MKINNKISKTLIVTLIMGNFGLIASNAQGNIDNIVEGRLNKEGRAVATAENAVAVAEGNATSTNISTARALVNDLPESLDKDALQKRLDNISSVSDITLPRKNATANLDVYLRSENSISLSLDTNSILFDEVTVVADSEKPEAVKLSIKSSLPYEVNAYLTSEITNFDGDVIADKSILNIKASSENDYKAFPAIDTKLNLLDNQQEGNFIETKIDLRVQGDMAFKADLYKTTIKFEIAQK